MQVPHTMKSTACCCNCAAARLQVTPRQQRGSRLHAAARVTQARDIPKRQAHRQRPCAVSAQRSPSDPPPPDASSDGASSPAPDTLQTTQTIAPGVHGKQKPDTSIAPAPGKSRFQVAMKPDDSLAGKKAKNDDNEEKLSRDDAIRFVQLSQTPTFLIGEAVLALGFLALLDGGLSGDWLRYGYVNGKVQAALTFAAYAGLTFHTLIATYAARVAKKRNDNVMVAIARGFLGGTAELLRVRALRVASRTQQ